MKSKQKTHLNWLFLALLILVGCREKTGETLSTIIPPIVPEVTDTTEYVHVNREGGKGSFFYIQDLGSSPKDVYFIFTNPTSSDTGTAASINSQYSKSEPKIVTGSQPSITSTNHVNLEDYAREWGIGLRGTPEISKFNSNPPSFGPIMEGVEFEKAWQGPVAANSIGDSYNFLDSAFGYVNSIKATLRQQITADSRTLNIWVADNAWENCSKKNCMTQAMVDIYSEKFLKQGPGNDIWDWVTNIFGEPWGSHNYSNLIDASSSQQIDILFYDISNDNSIVGGILGFFFSKDNLKAFAQTDSNERLMFYMDSVLAATPEQDSSWDIQDSWPAEIVSTLAHEFQHMINFYQKSVLRAEGAGTEVWLNEMASLITEDFLADKIGVDGPRGVTFANGSAGSTGNKSGRLPTYNYYNYVGVTEWYEGNNTLINYAVNYALGAYLARNYGGASLFQKIIQNSKTNFQAIEQGLTDMGYNESWDTVLQKWGVANLLSSSTTASAGYRYNSGANFSSTLNGITYNLGSINLFNYYFNANSGPRLFTPTALQTELRGHYKTSNTYVVVGEALTGTLRIEINMPAGLRLTVVTKNSF